MREIKFRAWDPVEKRMSEPYSPFRNNDDDLLSYPLFEYGTLTNGGAYSHEIDDFDDIVMQYTGIKDKNGKEIYEGDICELGWHNDYHEGKYKVIFKDGCYTFTKINDESCILPFHFLNQNIKVYEIIGNIYENPELLK